MDNDVVSLGLLTVTRLLLETTSPWWGFASRRFYALSVLWLVLMGGASALSYLLRETWLGTAIFQGLVLLCYAPLVYIRLRGSIVYLVRRAAEPPFFVRNKDRLLIGLIVAAFSIGGTTLVAFFVK